MFGSRNLLSGKGKYFFGSILNAKKHKPILSFVLLIIDNDNFLSINVLPSDSFDVDGRVS
ncbi:MAG: hypothetical protein JWQ34_3192 [Mucilaginibacter sp.]|nr:hypothetical protein [Mucilaginibacter sp.]